MLMALIHLYHLNTRFQWMPIMACPVLKIADHSMNKIYQDLVQIIPMAMVPRMELLLSVVILIKLTITSQMELKVLSNKKTVVVICRSRLSSIKKSTRRRCLRFQVWVNELLRVHLFMGIVLINSKIMQICRTLWSHPRWVWVRGQAQKVRIFQKEILNFSNKVFQERS